MLLLILAKVLGAATVVFVVYSILTDPRGVLYALRLRLWLVIFSTVGTLAFFISFVWLIGALLYAPEGKRALAIILALDRLGNATTGGDGRETISSRIGRLQEAGTPMPEWAVLIGNFLDWLQPEHCKNSIGH